LKEWLWGHSNQEILANKTITGRRNDNNNNNNNRKKKKKMVREHPNESDAETSTVLS
jgi:hypothetical protein